LLLKMKKKQHEQHREIEYMRKRRKEA